MKNQILIKLKKLRDNAFDKALECKSGSQGKAYFLGQEIAYQEAIKLILELKGKY